jgi:acyl-CoA thioester hydrolase
MERARTEWLRALGASHAALADRDGIQFVVAALEIRYLRPARQK